MNFDDTILPYEFLTLESFDVRAVSNGWIVQICGYVFDEDNDWDDDPKMYQNLTVVTECEFQLRDLLVYLSSVERHLD